MFLICLKGSEITPVVEFFFTEASALKGSLQNSCSKQLFRNVTGRPASVLKKDSTLGILLGSMQEFSEQLFFQNTSGRMLPKFK